ncbi:MAG: class B sortase [Oscillospiraceae bacterium]|nr:class B sortase [Oscillospiraceae bacterium]
MNDKTNGGNLFDEDEALDEILSEFVDADTDLPEDLAALAEKYDVDIGEFPTLSETDRLVEQYRDHLSAEDYEIYAQEYEGDIDEPQVMYDELGRRVVYDSSRAVRQKEPGADDADIGKQTDTVYSAEDWRRSQKGRRKNRHRAESGKTGGAAGQNRPAFAVRFLRAFLPWKGDSSSVAASKVLLTVFVLILLVSGGFFGYSFWLNYRLPSVPPPSQVQTDVNGNTIDPRGKYPDMTFPDGLMDEFVELYALNQDFAGYLSMEGLSGSLSVPVVQGTDNKFYASHDFYKNESNRGTPFLDYKNDLLQVNQNTVIYGSDIARAYRSSVMEDYKTIEGFQNQPLITYWSRYGVYYWKIYAVMVTNGKAEQDNDYIFYFNTLQLRDEEHFEGYRRVLDQKKLYTTGVDLNYGDKLLTISAYDSSFEGAYTVIVARLTREGESVEVDTSLAVGNENPRYPQAWYDKRRLENPYSSAEKWFP